MSEYSMKNKRILITGGTGLLGKSLIEKSSNRHKIIATFLGDYSMRDTGQVAYLKLDIRNNEGFGKLFNDFKPDVVIHAVSVGSPDFAEKNKEYTWKVDITGTKNMIGLCEKFGTKLVYISSNGIYRGDKPPYAEDDLAEPINYYGLVKLEGEKLVKSSMLTFAIVRPILMYGWHMPFERANIVTIALDKLKNRDTVYAFDDVFCNPLLGDHCAEAIWKIIEDGLYDVFNIGGKDIVNIYQLVSMAADIFNLDTKLVRAVQQGFFEGAARRPKNTSYLTTKMHDILGLDPLPIREGLEIMKSQKRLG